MDANTIFNPFGCVCVCHFSSVCSLKLECEKLASEKTEMQRHYIMVSPITSLPKLYGDLLVWVGHSETLKRVWWVLIKELKSGELYLCFWLAGLMLFSVYSFRSKNSVCPFSVVLPVLLPFFLLSLVCFNLISFTSVGCLYNRNNVKAIVILYIFKTHKQIINLNHNKITQSNFQWLKNWINVFNIWSFLPLKNMLFGVVQYL